MDYILITTYGYNASIKYINSYCGASLLSHIGCMLPVPHSARQALLALVVVGV
jgi:hypothetical protein